MVNRALSKSTGHLNDFDEILFLNAVGNYFLHKSVVGNNLLLLTNDT